MSPRDAIAAQTPRLRRYARALVGDRSRADDLVQDCLERALARADGWRSGDSPRKWLFAILHNIYVDDVRRRARRPRQVALDLAAEDAQAAPESDPAAMLDIEAALRLLPGEQRAVVLLVGLEGLSYAEAAQVLSVPIGTVMSRLARGRERLRRHLDHDRDGRPRLTRVK